MINALVWRTGDIRTHIQNDHKNLKSFLAVSMISNTREDCLSKKVYITELVEQFRTSFQLKVASRHSNSPHALYSVSPTLPSKQ